MGAQKGIDGLIHALKKGGRKQDVNQPYCREELSGEDYRYERAHDCSDQDCAGNEEGAVRHEQLLIDTFLLS